MKDPRKEIRMTAHRVELFPNTMQFKLREQQRAIDYAWHSRSYVDRTYNGHGEFVGWHVPR